VVGPSFWSGMGIPLIVGFTATLTTTRAAFVKVLAVVGRDPVPSAPNPRPRAEVGLSGDAVMRLAASSARATASSLIVAYSLVRMLGPKDEGDAVGWR
jgi:hypothetical protein